MVALLGVGCRWGDAGGDEEVKFIDERNGLSAQIIVDLDGLTFIGSGIKDVAESDGDVENFLQAKCLSTELDVICVVLFGFATFVFDGDDLGYCARAFVVVVQFDEVGFADDIVGIRPKVDASENFDAGSVFGGRRVMYFLVEMLAFNGKPVFSPEMFDVDEGTLAFAETQVLKC